MNIIIGLLIIAIGAFCQSSCYVPINKIKGWAWESYWIVQGVFAWLILPFLGLLLAVPAGHSVGELFAQADSFNIWMAILFGVLWGIGITVFKNSNKGIWPAGVGTVVTVLCLLLCAGWNNTAYYPSNVDLQSSLTIQN